DQGYDSPRAASAERAGGRCARTRLARRLLRSPRRNDNNDHHRARPGAPRDVRGAGRDGPDRTDDAPRRLRRAAGDRGVRHGLRDVAHTRPQAGRPGARPARAPRPQGPGGRAAAARDRAQGTRTGGGGARARRRRHRALRWPRPAGGDVL
ncbi:MAG: hypothetical protein AVDCRST_MAG85-1589, partial [uncultured Solirubrobacteraceae bacterium]